MDIMAGRPMGRRPMVGVRQWLRVGNVAVGVVECEQCTAGPPIDSADVTWSRGQIDLNKGCAWI
jgi:hypothetical protein